MTKSRGFTLLEVLIAITLFAILATITSSSMYYAFNSRARVSEQADRLNALQLTLSLIKQDTEQIAPRPVRGNDLHLFPALIGRSNYIEFTHGGLQNPNSSEKRSTLARVAFLCQKNRLIRRNWSSLDIPNRRIFEDRVLLDSLKECHFAFLDANQQVLQEWRGNIMPNAPSSEQLPKAIQFNLTLPNWGKGTFLFIVPGALYAKL